jgi:choline-glycine betaine transporter
MFVQRFAKAIAVVISLAITVMFKDFASLRWLSVCTIVIIVIWLAAARYAGKRLQSLEAAVEPVL